MDRMGIYKITSPSNKIYIGQSINIDKRWDSYYKLHCKKQPKLYNSLKKHGSENHIFETIEECIESELLIRETYWKEYYKVLEVPSLCCRMDDKGGRLGEETKRKISENNKGISRNKGRIKSEEEIQKFINSNKGVSRNKGKKHSLEVRKTMGLKKGFKYSDESKQKMSKSKKDHKCSQETKDKISKSNKGKIKSEDTIKKLQNSNPNKKSILQIDPKTNKIINEFNSMKEAGRILGINANGITEVINGRQKTSFGYIWKLK